MKRPSVKVLNTMLAFGMLLLFVGLLFLVGFAGAGQKLILSTISILVGLAGLLFLYVYLAFSKTPFKLFAGLSLLMNGFFILCANKGLFSLGMKELWPVMILLISIALFAASRTKNKKFNINYDFTAIALFVLGGFFLLFSLDVIKHSMSQVMFMLLPVIFILSGIFLLVLFVQRKALLEMIPQEISEKFVSEEESDIEDELEDDNEDNGEKDPFENKKSSDKESGDL
ncbi:MAG: hypothetical protein K6E78_00960 [Treponema sp.]|nr:hypothetical protein [Treponema sp.]